MSDLSSLEGQPRLRIGLSTFRSFALNRGAIQQVLEAVSEGHRDRNALRSRTTLGTVYVEAMPRFAKMCGLLGESNILTALGEVICKKNCGLDLPATQWLMHYHSLCPGSDAPPFWKALYFFALQTGRFSRQELRTHLCSMAGLAPEGENRAIEHALLAFLGTYTKPEGLGSLRILLKEGDNYRVGHPAPPSSSVVGYAIAHYWEQCWPESTTVNLARLSEEGGPAKILMLTQQSLEDALTELARRGVLQVERKVPPYQVVRQWRSSEDLLSQIYD